MRAWMSKDCQGHAIGCAASICVLHTRTLDLNRVCSVVSTFSLLHIPMAVLGACVLLLAGSVVQALLHISSDSPKCKNPTAHLLSVVELALWGDD